MPKNITLEQMLELDKEKLADLLLKKQQQTIGLMRRIDMQEKIFQDIYSALEFLSSPKILHLENWDFYAKTIPVKNRYVKNLDLFSGDGVIPIDIAGHPKLDEWLRLAQASAHPNQSYIDKLKEAKEKVGYVIADVSGHGKPVFMVQLATLHSQISQLAEEMLQHYGDIPKELFHRVNDYLCDFMERKYYVALSYFEFFKNGHVKYINAANPLPLIYSFEYIQFGGLPIEQDTSSHPMGFIPTTDIVNMVWSRKDSESLSGLRKYLEVGEFALHNDDLIVIPTDWLTELIKGKKKFTNCLPDIIDNNKNSPLNIIGDQILEAALRFKKQEDDMTLVLARFRGYKNGYMKNNYDNMGKNESHI